jgi:hypothetical protein
VKNDIPLTVKRANGTKDLAPPVIRIVAPCLLRCLKPSKIVVLGLVTTKSGDGRVQRVAVGVVAHRALIGLLHLQDHQARAARDQRLHRLRAPLQQAFETGVDHRLQYPGR